MEEGQENLIPDDESEQDSIVKLGRISDLNLENIENIENNEEPPKKDIKKISSFQTVFSVWNSMMGSSIISLPYNVYKAGIIPTVIIGILYGYINYLTCAVVVRLGKKESEFSKVVYNYFYYGFGKKVAKVAKILQITFNLMINTGIIFIFFLIINQNLFPCICLFLRLFSIDINSEDLSPHLNKFSLFYCVLIFSIIIFPLTIVKEMHFLSKLNSYGIYFISASLIFMIYTGISSLVNNNLHFEYKENIEGSKDRNLFLFGQHPGLMAGTFSLGYFCHSFILPLMKNNRNQENNQRDLFIGYICVTITYITVGIMGYIGFSGSEFSPDFKDNWYRFFKSDNYFILVLRIFNVIQLTLLFPMCFHIVRTELMEKFFKSYIDSFRVILIFSMSLLGLCAIILYLCYDILGILIGYVGAITSLVLVYTIPPLINMINYYIRHQPKKEIEKLKENKEELDLPINTEEIVPLKPSKAFIFYYCMLLIILLGFITLFLQIKPVNFFGIKIEKNK